MIALDVMAAIYLIAGVVHFIKPSVYRPVMPPYIPWHDAMIYLSGLAEVILGVGLIYQPTRAISAWGVIALLWAVFPVHIYMYQARHTKFRKTPSWFIMARIPVQFLLMLWAYQYTGAQWPSP